MKNFKHYFAEAVNSKNKSDPKAQFAIQTAGRLFVRPTFSPISGRIEQIFTGKDPKVFKTQKEANGLKKDLEDMITGNIQAHTKRIQEEEKMFEKYGKERKNLTDRLNKLSERPHNEVKGDLAKLEKKIDLLRRKMDKNEFQIKGSKQEIRAYEKIKLPLKVVEIKS